MAVNQVTEHIDGLPESLGLQADRAIPKEILPQNVSSEGQRPARVLLFATAE